MLVRELNKKGYLTKSWVSGSGVHHKGAPFTKTTLYRILKNPTYIGKTPHKGNVYDGEHDAIIGLQLWEKTRALIESRTINSPRLPRTDTPALLRGLLVDRDGYAMSPAAARKKGKTYRYYVSYQAVKKSYDDCPLKTVSAGLLEDIVLDQVKRVIARPEWAARIMRQTRSESLSEQKILKTLRSFDTVWNELFPIEQCRILNLLVQRIIVHPEKIQIIFHPLGMASLLQEMLPDIKIENRQPTTDEPVTVELPMQFRVRGGRKFITAPDGKDIVSSKAPRPDAAMIKALIRGFEFTEMMDADHTLNTRIIGKRENLDMTYVAKFIRMAQLAPDIIHAILNGRQPQGLTLSELLRPFPDNWVEQRQHFGFGAA